MKGTFACDKKQSGAWDENEIDHEITQGNKPPNNFLFCQASIIHDKEYGKYLDEVYLLYLRAYSFLEMHSKIL